MKRLAAILSMCLLALAFAVSVGSMTGCGGGHGGHGGGHGGHHR